ncbi:EamA family transporter RarD [Agrococcus jejuensis]|uniref:Chloramphenicol-sensitive protein RarD n=1 Tax=Agrococcus jejuensis TaxID=399736 RepID=A0A1G8DX42_9MICO|nr:EamA family transporter RarD [Agrococcus jejuensis]SDH62030.1 chloramphenicol-sensitive protein RarD [Agrococcus jejuensis]
MLAPVRAASSLRSGVGLGVAASIGASVLFGVLFLLPPLLAPLTGIEIVAWRVVVMLPVLIALFAATVGLRDVARVLARIRRRPVLALVLVADAALLSVQLWLFGWAPIAGHGLDTATGYLLLPLAMVLVGVVLHGERLSRMRGAAVAAAVLGVVAALAVGGSVGFTTALVALGYPIYFDLRRRFGLDGPGATVLEQLVLLPVAIVVLVAHAASGAAAVTWGHAPMLALLGVVSGTALWMYLSASRMLPFGLFGLLTYVEPVLLVVVSTLLLGEAVGASDALVYGPIAVALVLLALEPWLARRRGEPPTTTQPIPH